MQLDITGRHVDVTAALRDFTEDKLGKLERLLDGPVEVHVVLGIEKHRHYAEIQVKARNGVFSSSQETGDLYASIGEVCDKLERQALKHKQKLQDHKHRKSPRDPEVAATIEANAQPVGSAQDDPEPVARIVRSRGYHKKPLSAEDAAYELDASGDEVLVYRDVDTDAVHVVFRKKDGNIGLVSPES